MSLLFLLVEIPICVTVCALICKKLDTRRHKKFCEEIHGMVKNEVIEQIRNSLLKRSYE